MKDLHTCYEQACSWQEGGDISTRQIIEDTIEALLSIDTLSENLCYLLEMLADHINNNDKQPLDEWTLDGEILIEDISGYLGEYLKN